MFRLAIFLFLLLGVMSTIAQSTSENAIADIDQLFTSNVEIVDYGLASPNHIRYDNDARLLSIGSHSYPYPDEIAIITSSRSIMDDEIQMQVHESLPELQSSRKWVWTFNIDTERFTRFVNPCSNSTNLTVTDIKSPWIYVKDPDNGQVHLCELATGKTSTILPSNLSWEVQPPISSSPAPVFTSPDNQWLLLIGEADDQIHVFSYNITSESLTQLGQVNCRYCVEWEAVKWYGSVVTVWLVDVAGDRTMHFIYRADVSISDSLELVLTRPLYLPEYYNDPPRYDYVNFTTPENIWDTQCEHITYDVLSGEKHITDMGSVCRTEQGSLDGIGYYRDVTRGEQGIAALTRFDAINGEHEILYEGEIELIEWVSPDEKDAVLVLGSDGRINILPFLDSHTAWGLSEPPKLAYVDLVNDTIIFETWTDWRWCHAPLGGPDWHWNKYVVENAISECASIGPEGAILPRDDGTLLIIGTFEPQYSFGYNDSTRFADILSIQNQSVVQRTRIAEGGLIPYSADYIIQVEWNETYQSKTYSLIPVDEGSSIQITNEIEVDVYQDMSLTHIDPFINQMSFYISPERLLERGWLGANVTVQIEIP